MLFFRLYSLIAARILGKTWQQCENRSCEKHAVTSILKQYLLLILIYVMLSILAFYSSNFTDSLRYEDCGAEVCLPTGVSLRATSAPVSVTGDLLDPDTLFRDSKKNDTVTMSLPDPIVITGPSGVGKGTLIQKLMSGERKDLFGFSVSHTTRKPRPGEVDGVHYHFTTRERMEEGIRNGEFIEHAEVHGNFYGTSYESVQTVRQSNKICILDIDVQGVQNLKTDPSFRFRSVFIAPPSLETLENRLRSRGTETEEHILKRLGNASRELEYGLQDGNFDKVVVNGELEVASKKLLGALKGMYPDVLR